MGYQDKEINHPERAGGLLLVGAQQSVMIQVSEFGFTAQEVMAYIRNQEQGRQYDSGEHYALMQPLPPELNCRKPRNKKKRHGGIYKYVGFGEDAGVKAKVYIQLHAT